jgi:hypothetical protein
LCPTDAELVIDGLLQHDEHHREEEQRREVHKRQLLDSCGERVQRYVG